MKVSSSCALLYGLSLLFATSPVVMAKTNLRASRKLSAVVMSKPCTLVENTEEGNNRHWDCRIDPADANGVNGLILPIDGWYLPSMAVDSRLQPVVAGVTTMFGEGMQVDGDRVYVPPGTQPQLERPSNRGGTTEKGKEAPTAALDFNYTRPASAQTIPIPMNEDVPLEGIATTATPPFEDPRPQDPEPIVATNIGDMATETDNNDIVLTPQNEDGSTTGTTSADVVHNCTDLYEFVDIVMSSGVVNKKYCSELGAGLCQRSMTNGMEVFYACPGTCAEYTAVRTVENFPPCGRAGGNLVENPLANQVPITTTVPPVPISRPMRQPCVLLGEDVYFENDSHQFFWRCEIEDGIVLPIEGYLLTAKAYDDYGQPFVSGVTTMFSTDIQIEQTRIFVPPGVRPTIELPESYNPEEKQQPRVPIEGVKPVLVVRVVGADAETGMSQTRISDSIFGTGLGLDTPSVYNFKRQVEDCSFNKTKIVPAEDTEGTSLTVYGGVVDVMIEDVIQGAKRGDIANAVTYVLQANGFSLPGDYHHVVYCLPRGTSGVWKAYSFVNHWSSVYNDNECIEQGVLMHHIGHNMGLSNAEEHHASGDQTNMMGHPIKRPDGPKMCYNGPHSYQLGWYEDKQVEYNPITAEQQQPWRGNLVGMVDYETSDDAKTVIVKITTNATTDYYVSFNRAEGFNNDTNDGPNEVLVHKMGTEEFTDSLLVAKLGPNCAYSFWDDGATGQLITIKVNAITGLLWAVNPTGQPVMANVQIQSRDTSAPGPPVSLGKSCAMTPAAMPNRGAATDKTAGPPPGEPGHSCVDDPSGEAEVQLPAGGVRTQSCSTLGGGLCKKPLANGNGHAYDVCSGSCAEFPGVRGLPDFPACGRIPPASGASGAQGGRFGV